MTDKERIDNLESELRELKSRLCPDEKKEKKERKPKEPSVYNNFVKEFLAEQKTAKGSEYNHKVAFKEAAEAWSKKKSEK